MTSTDFGLHVHNWIVKTFSFLLIMKLLQHLDLQYFLLSGSWRRWLATYLLRKQQKRKWNGTAVALATCAFCVPPGNCSIYFVRICRIQTMMRVFDFYPMSTLHFVGFLFLKAKNSLGRVETLFDGNEPGLSFTGSGMRPMISWKATLFNWNFFSNNTKLVSCNWKHDFFDFNEFRNLWESINKIELRNWSFSRYIWVLIFFQ